VSVCGLLFLNDHLPESKRTYDIHFFLPLTQKNAMLYSDIYFLYYYGLNMILIKLLGRFFLLFAFAEVAIGICVWLAGHDVTNSAGEIWYTLGPGSLNLSQAIVQRYLLPEFWELVALPLLLRPFWESVMLLFIFFLVLGSSIVFFSQHRPRVRTSERP
jgi:hypothetical protein